jgi:hypothetical protein
VLTFFLLFYVAKRYRETDQLELKTLGKKNGVESEQIKSEFQRVLLLRYSKQQNWAFGLLWFSIAVSICLGVTIIYQKFVQEDTTDMKIIGELIGLAGGSGISISSFRLYRISSKKLEEVYVKL